MDFDTEAQRPMDPKEIDESLLGMRAEVEPKVPKKVRDFEFPLSCFDKLIPAGL